MDLSEIASVVSGALAGRPEGIVAAYIFGSVARGTAGPKSDVDVAVLLAKDPPHTLDGLGLGIQGVLESRLRQPTQVIVLNRAPVDLVHRVLRDGRLVVDADPSRRIAFEVKARNAFFDLEPHLRRYRRYGGRVAS